MVKCKYEGTGIWDGRCTGTKEVDHCPGYDKCERYKPDYKTNADRIRSMSDEELADMMTVMNGGFTCHECFENNGGRCNAECVKNCFNWLKQPSE